MGIRYASDETLKVPTRIVALGRRGINVQLLIEARILRPITTDAALPVCRAQAFVRLHQTRFFDDGASSREDVRDRRNSFRKYEGRKT